MSNEIIDPKRGDPWPAEPIHRQQPPRTYNAYASVVVKHHELLMAKDPQLLLTTVINCLDRESQARLNVDLEGDIGTICKQEWDGIEIVRLYQTREPWSLETMSKVYNEAKRILEEK
jgi:hypothetical protein